MGPPPSADNPTAMPGSDVTVSRAAGKDTNDTA